MIILIDRPRNTDNVNGVITLVKKVKSDKNDFTQRL